MRHERLAAVHEVGRSHHRELHVTDFLLFWATEATLKHLVTLGKYWIRLFGNLSFSLCSSLFKASLVAVKNLARLVLDNLHDPVYGTILDLAGLQILDHLDGPVEHLTAWLED